MSTTSSDQDAHQSKKSFENARVFIVVYEGSVHLAKKLLQSAEASGNDTKKFIIVGTDGTEIKPFRNLPLDLPQGNPISANRAFMHVAKMCFDNQDDFIFLDADCTILGPEAIEKISYELMSRDGTVLGQPVWTHNDYFHGWSWNGNAAYKWQTWERFHLQLNPIPDDEPFDLWLSKKFFQGHCAGTGLYHNTLQGESENVKNLGWLPEQAVLHHPCKDGSVADCVVAKFNRKYANA